MTRSAGVQRTLSVVLVGLLVAIALVILTGARGSSGASPPTSSTFAGPELPAHLRAADFTLRDQNGRAVSLSAHRGQVVVLTFVHSQCHDACPFMVEQIKGALAQLPAGEQVPAIGISVAPGEDSAAHRRAFLAKYEVGGGRFAYLSGPVDTLRRIWRAYAIQPLTKGIDHSTFVLLIDKRGYERVGFPASALTPEGLVHDIAVLERERT